MASQLKKKINIKRFLILQEKNKIWLNFIHGSTAHIPIKNTKYKKTWKNLHEKKKEQKPKAQKKPPYSLKKRRVKPIPEYSMLYLETISDSLSKRSKGAQPNSIKIKLLNKNKLKKKELKTLNINTKLKKQSKTSKEILKSTTQSIEI